MGLEKNPDDKTLEGVYKELDEDGSNDVSLDELEVFLRRIFILQRDEINRVIRIVNSSDWDSWVKLFNSNTLSETDSLSWIN